MLAIASTTEYEPALRAVYASDPAIIHTYHVAAPCTLETAVAHSVLTLKTADDDFRFYELWEDNVLVGFFGVEENFNYVPTFGLVRGARTPENKAELLALFRKFTDGYRAFAVGVNRCNTRVVRFMERVPGGQKTAITPEHFIFFFPQLCPPSF